MGTAISFDCPDVVGATIKFTAVAEPKTLLSCDEFIKTFAIRNVLVPEPFDLKGIPRNEIEFG